MNTRPLKKRTRRVLILSPINLSRPNLANVGCGFGKNSQSTSVPLEFFPSPRLPLAATYRKTLIGDGIRSTLRSPKTKQFVWWGILWVAVVGSILGLYFVRQAFSPVGILYAQAAESDAKIGPATERFIQELKTIGFESSPWKKITRTSFSVPGVIITLDKDNIQVFEYPDSETARKEVSLLAEKYTSRAYSSHWGGSSHLYVKDTLAIFYLGNDKNVLKALVKNAGLSLNR
ncbi:MAG: hypothetical protein NTY66_03505 [Candidatus Vogelbacteria bacterium]|nr:hypothetical protein [Candidatus Vogelbacteria bacterium]